MKIRKIVHKDVGIGCCLISHRLVFNEKCIMCEREFHGKESSSDNPEEVSLSTMTYIEYGKADACYHLELNTVTKKYSCIKVSENNTESSIDISESLLDILTSQSTIDELMKGKWIKEMEDSLYDGEYYHYIIQQGRQFYHSSIACGFVWYWPLFYQITNELF